MQRNSLFSSQSNSKTRAWTWALDSPQSRLRHASPLAARAARQLSRGGSIGFSIKSVSEYVSEHQSHGSLGNHGHRQQQQQQVPLQQQHSSSPAVHRTQRPRNAAGHLLPDQLLFSSIKACSSLFDCQQLLSANKQQLDAMLLSTLVTQTVYVAVGQPEQQQQQAPVLNVQQHTTATAAASYAASQSANTPSSSSRSSRAAGSAKAAAQALSRHLRQLSELASQLCSSFRPQQFSNVLWGLAKCGFKAPAAWLGPYLEQAELQLHHFQPRNLAQLAWALAAMKAQPPRSFLANFLAECSDKLSLFKPIDLAHTLWALATLAVTPPADWLSSALAACSAQWQQFKPQELSITVWGLARLGGGFRTQLYPAHPHYGLTAELGEGGLAGLMAAAAWQVPAMSPQQASNLVWGLAVGGAVLPPQQLQALAGQVLLVLRNSAVSCCSHALTTVTWALTKMQWTPSQAQGALLLQLLQQHQQQHSLSLRQASLLLWCLGKLRLRLPADVMIQLMAQMQGSMHLAEPADVVQVLAGIKTLGWRPSEHWWRRFYSSSSSSGSVLLEQASVSELAQLLAAAAAVKPVRPDKGWWLGFWKQVGAALDATFEARRLQRSGQLVQRACSSSNSSSSSSSSSSSASVQGRSTAARMAQLRARLLQAGSSSSSSNSSSVTSKRRQQRRAQAAASERALLAVNPWPVIHKYMQQYLKLRAAAAPLPLVCASAGQQQQQHALVGPHSALLLLWAAAKLRLGVPKMALWQLLVLVITDLHCYNPGQMVTLMQTLGVMLRDRGHDAVQCHSLLKLLAVAAQWRLHQGRAGDCEVCGRYVRALKFMAAEANVSQLLVLSWRAEAGAGG